MPKLTSRLSNGAALVPPASLDAITTYVVLEQEAWFEKEARFISRWLAPGMTAIDIGASHVVSTVPMARPVRRQGAADRFAGLAVPGGDRHAQEPNRDPGGRAVHQTRPLVHGVGRGVGRTKNRYPIDPAPGRPPMIASGAAVAPHPRRNAC
jgi:hypothetical protein